MEPNAKALAQNMSMGLTGTLHTVSSVLATLHANHPTNNCGNSDPLLSLPFRKPQKGREAAAPSFIKEIQEVQGGQEEPHNVGAIIPKDA